MLLYPDLSQKTLTPLRVVQEQLRLHPDYLDQPDCPYDAETKALLRLLAPDAASRGTNLFHRRTGSKQEILEDEAADLYQEIKDFGSRLKVDDVTERMSYFRTRTTLLEKLITLHERASSMKAFSRFQDVVLGIMEDLMDPKQREEAMSRLRAVLDAPGNDE